MRLWSIISGACAALALATAPALAQRAPQAQARELARGLEAQTARLAAEGYALAAGPLTGELAPGETGRISVRLWAGQEYVFAGACEAGCGDLDLRLVDPMLHVLGAESNGQTAPILRVTPVMTGQHAIEAEIGRCAGRTCWFAVNVYAR